MNPFDQFDDVAAAAPPPNPFDQFDPPPETPQATEAPQKGLGERTMDNIEATKESVVDSVFGEDANFDTSNIDQGILDTFGAPTQDPAKRAQSATADVLQGASNIVVDGGLTMLDTLVPDALQDRVINFARDKWEQISTNPVMKEGLELAQQGWDAYKGWANANPDEAERIEEVFTVVPGIKAKPKGGLSGEGLVRKGKRQKTVTNRGGQITEMLEPIAKKPSGKGRGRGRWEANPDGVHFYEPSDWEKARNKEIIKIKDVKPKKSAFYNRNVVEDKAVEVREALEAKIMAKGNPEVKRASIVAAMSNAIDSIGTEDLLSPGAREHAITIYKKAMDLIDKSDGTAAGVLQARRDLDKWVYSKKGDIFDADIENGLSVANKKIRDVLNNQVEKAVGPSVRSSLDKQHKLLSARDLLDARGHKELATPLGRFKHGIEQQFGFKFPTTPVAMLTLGSVATFAPVFAGTIAGGAGLYGLVKVLRGPRAKILLGEMQKMADRFPVLKPQVNAVIQAAEGLGPIEEEPVE